MASRKMKYQCICINSEGKECLIGADTKKELAEKLEQYNLKLNYIKK